MRYISARDARVPSSLLPPLQSPELDKPVLSPLARSLASLQRQVASGRGAQRNHSICISSTAIRGSPRRAFFIRN